MKKIFLLIVTLAVFAGCKDTLSDVTLNDNPYDKDYEGPQVVRITNCTTVMVGSGSTAVPNNKIYLAPATGMYSRINLYRNGTLIKTVNRQSYTGYLSEVVIDNTPVYGTSYSYEVALKSEESTSPLSYAVSYTTIP